MRVVYEWMINGMGDMYWIYMYIYTAAGYSANEGNFKMAYFGKSFHFKQLHNEGGSLGIGMECGDLR